MPEVSYTYYAKLKRVIDGDTCDFDIDLGLHVHVHLTVRFKGFNAPELKGKNKAQAEAAKAELETLLSGETVILTTEKSFQQTFARYLATVSVAKAGGWVDVAEHMIKLGYNVKQGD
jgi:endonuclease YncB( thermonuclease family)